jgi:signal transduction histidine kinase
MFGYSASEARQLQFRDLRVKAGAAPLTTTQATEAQLRRKDGSVFWAEVSAVELQVGTSTRAVINLRDITDRKRAESLAQEMEHRIRQIYENLPVAVFAIDAQHRVTFWNPQMTRLTGVKAQDVVGTTDSWRGIYPSKRPCLLDVLVDGTKADDITRFFGDNLRASTQVPGALEGEGYFTNAAQTQGMWGRFCASPLRDADGTITGAIETMIDITPLKRIQTDLETLNRELEARVETRNAELQRAMGQLLQSEKLAALGSLVAGMAHELNTPIGNVLAVASTLTEDAASFSQKLLSGSARRGDVEKGALRLQEASVLIERNATRAAKLISDFKEVAVDQTSSRRRHFSLLEVMQEILHTTQPLFKGKGHTVTLDIPPDLELDSYPGPLEQIMTNLLANSVHHAFAADGAGEMVIRAESQGEQILLHYRDNGCGIPAANLAHIFEPFYTTKLGKGGSGLGMYLVYNLVSNVLGGRIQVQSPPGEGTWVDITIPRIAPDVATHPLAKSVSQPGF